MKIYFKNISKEDYNDSNCIIKLKNNEYCIYPNSSEKYLCLLEEEEGEKTENEDEITNCDKEKILKNECNSTITNNQIKEIYNYLKNILNNEDYTEENLIIETKNIIFQLSRIEEQKKLIFVYQLLIYVNVKIYKKSI